MAQIATQISGRWQAAMIIAAILPLLDSSLINVILPDIAQSLQGDLVAMPWLVTLYLIASAAGVLLSGYLTARWGYRCVWRASLTVFAVASLLVALASRFDLMLLSRTLLGVAAGVMMVQVPTLIVVSVAADQVKTMMGRISVLAVFAPAIGPLLGALLSASGSWRFAFWLNLPLVVAALWLSGPTVCENVRSAAVRFNRLVFLLFFLAFFCLMLSLLWGLYFTVAALLLFALATWLNQTMAESLLTLTLFRHAHYAAQMGLGLITSLVFYGFLVYYPLAAVSQGAFPVWYLGAMLALQGIGSGISRWLFYPRLAQWSDFGVMALGLALSLVSLVLIMPGTLGWQALGFLVRGGGIGLALLVLLSAPYRLTPRIWLNDTSMLIRMVQLIGGVLGSLFSTALLSAQVRVAHGYLGFIGITLLAMLGAAYSAWRLGDPDT